MLQRTYRLRRRSDFHKLHRHGRSCHGATFTLKYRPNRLPHSRAAVVVSTKVAKRATVRNRTRRRFYAQLQQLWPQLKPGYDLVILTRQPATDLREPQLSEQLRSCFRRAGILH